MVFFGAKFCKVERGGHLLDGGGWWLGCETERGLSFGFFMLFDVWIDGYITFAVRLSID